MLSVALLVCQAAAAPADGYDLFYEIVRELEADREPAPALWNKLFATPGYRYLEESQDQGGSIRRGLKLALKPSERGRRDAILAEDGYSARVLRHLRGYAERKSEIDKWREELLASDWVATALERTREYLPPGIASIDNVPAIHVIAFGPDGYGSENTIVIDALFSLEQGHAGTESFLAHELHHVYVGRLDRPRPPARTDPAFDLYHSIAQLQLEGTADLIDKRHLLDATERPTGWYEEQYFDHFHKTAETFAKIDGLIVEFSEGGRKAQTIAREIRRSLPFGAHPNGGFMGKLALEEFGKDAVVATLSNPFDFFRLYQKAATRRDGAWVFSDPSVKVLAELEARLVE